MKVLCPDCPWEGDDTELHINPNGYAICPQCGGSEVEDDPIQEEE